MFNAIICHYTVLAVPRIMCFLNPFDFMIKDINIFIVTDFDTKYLFNLPKMQ